MASAADIDRWSHLERGDKVLVHLKADCVIDCVKPNDHL